MRPVAVLIGVAAVLLVVFGGVAAESKVVGYDHRSATLTLPRGEWVTVGNVAAGGCCQTITFGLQVPVVQNTGGRIDWVGVRMVRMPKVDGTGNQDFALPRNSPRTWHISHSHTVAGFAGRMHMQVYVEGRGTWKSPYRISKASRH